MLLHDPELLSDIASSDTARIEDVTFDTRVMKTSYDDDRTITSETKRKNEMEVESAHS